MPHTQVLAQRTSPRPVLPGVQALGCLCLSFAAVSAAWGGGLADHTARLPERLSDIGWHPERQGPSTPHAFRYEPAWPLWSNGSDKERYVVIPDGTRIDTSDPLDWKFPVGTLFFKTFSFETAQGRRLVETRVIRGLESGWELGVYAWKPDGSEAQLVDISSPRPVELTARDGQLIRHEIPSRLQCRQCHEANGNFIIGFSELNLNRPLAAASGGAAGHTQLRDLQARRAITHLSTRPADLEDDDLGARAVRGYVQGNCVHCHNGRSQFDLSHDVFLGNTLSRPTRGFLFPGGTRIVPGRPDESLLYLAFARSHPFSSIHMPPVGVQQPDTAMIRQVAGWIASLKDRRLPEPPAQDLLSPGSRAAYHDRQPGYVPNRHVSPPGRGHRYALDFERLTLDADHSATGGFTGLRFLPGGSLFLLAEHEGRISLYELAGQRARRRGEFRLPDVHVNIECGLVSMELDPDFASNSLFYVGYCHKDATQVQIARLRLDLSDPGRTAESLTPVLSLDAPGAQPWHTIGSILFDADKRMWILTGERGLSAPAQDLGSLLGAALRIVPNRAGQEAGYRIPDDNPKARWYTRGRGELMAKGLRNPWTGTFDHVGRLWIADVGQQFEELNLLDPRRGFHDYGWPTLDGPCDYGCRGTVNPVLSYTRSSDHPYALEDPGTFPVPQQCVYVGPQYVPADHNPYGGRLDHVLLFGDFILGWVRGLALDRNGQVTGDRLLGNMPGITSWSRGPDGHLYVCTYAAYTQDVVAVYKVVAASAHP